MVNRPEPMNGITIREIDTSRLRQNVYLSGAETAAPVIFIHGNCASALHWEETMLALPRGYRGIAPDLRGYGWTEPVPADATCGLRDYAADIDALADTLRLTRFHLVGHSMGAGVAMQYVIDHPARLLSLALVDTVSPFGFGGVKTVDGRPTWPDFAGSGGGTVNPVFVQLIRQEERGGDDPNSPRAVINSSYYKPPFKYHREEEILTSLLSTRTGDDFYPGDMVPSPNWPNVAPGTRGVANAFSPKHADVSGIVDIDPKPPVLWIQAADDLIVSDNSFFEFGTLGRLGLVPGWPGEDVYPGQPMVSQTRFVLDAYRAKGGSVEEHTIPDSGHCVYLNQPQAFQALLNGFLKAEASS